MSIYVGNISYDVTEADLKEVFEDYGSVKRIHVPTDKDTGRRRGFAFVELSTKEEESNAIQTLDGADWWGRKMKVDEARPRN